MLILDGLGLGLCAGALLEAVVDVLSGSLGVGLGAAVRGAVQRLGTLRYLEAIIIVIGEEDGVGVAATTTTGVGRFVTADVLVGPGEVPVAELLQVELGELRDGVYWRCWWCWWRWWSWRWWRRWRLGYWSRWWGWLGWLRLRLRLLWSGSRLTGWCRRSRGSWNGLLLWLLKPKSWPITSESESPEERRVVLRTLLLLGLEVVGGIGQVDPGLNDVSNRVEQIREQLSSPTSLGVVGIYTDVDVVGYVLRIFLGFGR